MNARRAKEIIQRFGEYNILVIGDVCLDEYVVGAVERVNPEATAPLLHAQSERVATGCAGNVAKNLASLGVAAQLVSVVGQDKAAGIVMTEAHNEGYEAFLVRDSARPTSRKVRYLHGSQQLLRVDHEDVKPLSLELAKQ